MVSITVLEFAIRMQESAVAMACWQVWPEVHGCVLWKIDVACGLWHMGVACRQGR